MYDYPMLVWTAAGAIGQCVSALSLFFTIFGLLRERRLQREALANIERERRLAHYSMIDNSYQQLLELRLANCFLGSPSLCDDDSKREKYSVYAFMVWNFIETILDLTVEDEVLKRTWYPIVIYESNQHSKWINDPENQKRFKPPVIEWAKNPGSIPYNPNPKESKSETRLESQPTK